MGKTNNFVVSLLVFQLLSACSTTLVAQRPLAAAAEDAPPLGERCWATDDCSHGKCEDGYCVDERSRPPTFLDRIGGVLEGKSATVLLAGDEPVKISAKELKIGVDRTQWLELGQSTNAYVSKTVPTEALRQISVVDRGRGAVEGLGLGTLAGLATGALVGANVGSSATQCGPGERQSTDPPPGTSTAVCFSMLGAIGGVILGAPVGLLLGALIGHRTTIQF